MHHVFEVDEILRLIASSLVYEDTEGAISFACCSKSISAPTLDTIWGIYYCDFTQLLRTLPPRVWTIRCNTFYFVHRPSEAEWARFSIYARRLRRLTTSESIITSRTALKLLNVHFSNRCMVPNLREIRWINASPMLLESTPPLVVSPVLTSFQLRISYFDYAIDASQLIFTYKALALACNSLVEIRLWDSAFHDPRIIGAISTLLLKCNPDKLRRFRAHAALSEEGFLHAAQLPNLVAFSMNMDTAELGAPLPTSIFPSLESLDIQATVAHPPLLQIITRIQSKTFSHLQMEFPAAILGTFLPKTLECLQQRSFHQTLSTLVIYPEGPFELDRTFVRPLLFLQELSVLDIGLVCPEPICLYRLSDEDLDELVKALPKLKSLRFGCIPCDHPADNTIKTLVSIAKHCKHLDELLIHINVEAIINEVAQRENWGDGLVFQDPFSPSGGCPVRNITLGRYPIPDLQGAIQFAVVLTQLFPRLNAVTSSPFPYDHTQPLWQLVSCFITTYRRNIDAAIADVANDIRG